MKSTLNNQIITNEDINKIRNKIKNFIIEEKNFPNLPNRNENCKKISDEIIKLCEEYKNFKDTVILCFFEPFIICLNEEFPKDIDLKLWLSLFDKELIKFIYYINQLKENKEKNLDDLVKKYIYNENIREKYFIQWRYIILCLHFFGVIDTKNYNTLNLKDINNLRLKVKNFQEDAKKFVDDKEKCKKIYEDMKNICKIFSECKDTVILCFFEPLLLGLNKLYPNDEDVKLWLSIFNFDEKNTILNNKQIEELNLNSILQKYRFNKEVLENYFIEWKHALLCLQYFNQI